MIAGFAARCGCIGAQKKRKAEMAFRCLFGLREAIVERSPSLAGRTFDRWSLDAFANVDFQDSKGLLVTLQSH